MSIRESRNPDQAVCAMALHRSGSSDIWPEREFEEPGGGFFPQIGSRQASIPVSVMFSTPMWSQDHAFALMHDVWTPTPVWTEFIKEALDRHGLRAEPPFP